jgi:hypothetical protein
MTWGNPNFITLEAAAADKHVVHRSELSLQKAGSLGFERDRRPP